MDTWLMRVADHSDVRKDQDIPTLKPSELPDLGHHHQRHRRHRPRHRYHHDFLHGFLHASKKFPYWTESKFGIYHQHNPVSYTIRALLEKKQSKCRAKASLRQIGIGDGEMSAFVVRGVTMPKTKEEASAQAEKASRERSSLPMSSPWLSRSPDSEDGSNGTVSGIAGFTCPSGSSQSKVRFACVVGSVVCNYGLLSLCVCLTKEGIIWYAGLLECNRKSIVV
ncbi:hypothetical protein HPB47_022648 [Ixodes persulcatus]|uniref:Uncharacterized protein n=1 Tax=Ixodes persulcatus TaxID=34615 RepID=A0AC60Q9C8_IXOPE|nr:hypothetical protein HPB47_022648 [Ixodes persulcatus]